MQDIAEFTFKWKIDSGRVYDAMLGEFIDEYDEREVAELWDRTDPGNPALASVAFLRRTILFYQSNGTPLILGKEVQSKVDTIQAVQTRYSVQIVAFQEAYLSAQIDGDEETMAEIAEEKQALRSAMADEIRKIQQEGE